MPEQSGDFIWYELLTPDADGARMCCPSLRAPSARTELMAGRSWSCFIM